MRSLISLHYRQVLNVWHRNFLLFKRSWTVSLFWILLEPIVVLGSIGYGVGTYINSMSGVSYVDFYFPALLASSSMMVAFFESTYSNFSKLTYQQTYVTMILSPLTPGEIIFGEVLWGATKGSLSALGILLVGIPLGLTDSFYVFPAFIVIFISSFLFSAMGMFVTSVVRNYDAIIYPTSGLIVPMSLLCGTYFPLDRLPVVIKYLSYLLPLTHTVLLTRSLMLKGFEWFQLFHLLMLILMTIFIYRLAAKRIERRLAN